MPLQIEFDGLPIGIPTAGCGDQAHHSRIRTEIPCAFGKVQFNPRIIPLNHVQKQKMGTGRTTEKENDGQGEDTLDDLDVHANIRMRGGPKNWLTTFAEQNEDLVFPGLLAIHNHAASDHNLVFYCNLLPFDTSPSTPESPWHKPMTLPPDQRPEP
jgi:hypothetical protein